MNNVKKATVFFGALITALFVIAFWQVAYNAAVEDSDNKEVLLSLAEALTTAVPLLFITLVIAIRSEKIAKRSNYIIQSETCLKELECWAQEMFVCTRHSPEDYNTVTGQAAAGVKYASIRHMLTRHGKDFKTDTTFPAVILRANQLDADVWKKRFAVAVINYMKWYGTFINIVGSDGLENGGNGLPYKDSFVGLLYQELINSYGTTPKDEDVMKELKTLVINIA